jgi:hypothetical protein
MAQIIKPIKKLLRRFPVVYDLVAKVYVGRLAKRFSGSKDYWIERYDKGGHSGAGSIGRLAGFKAEVLNAFVEEHDIQTIIEYGCGDGSQLQLANYKKYLGFDISPKALTQCQKTFGSDTSKTFKLMRCYEGENAELTLSLDVVYHLVEDDVFEDYMRRLFDSSTRYVIVYSSDYDNQEAIQVPHIRHRKFTTWVNEHLDDWTLIQHIPNRYRDIDEGSFASFYIYGKR